MNPRTALGRIAGQRQGSTAWACIGDSSSCLTEVCVRRKALNQ